jgi:hypothetical protein
VPVAVFAPNANQKYELTPVRKFYICYGSTQDRLAASITDLGLPVTIDFTGKNEIHAEVDLLPDFAWSDVRYTE